MNWKTWVLVVLETIGCGLLFFASLILTLWLLR
jgi:hypothetical protein